MRCLIWTWRVVLAVTVGTFIATAYYILHGEPSSMDSAMPALNLITVIGAALVGIAWTLSRRYWYTLILLVAMGLVRGLFDEKVLTEFQSLYVLVSIGVIGFVFVVTLTARALINDRALKAAKETGVSLAPGQTVSVTATRAPVVPVATIQEAPASEAAPASAAKPSEEAQDDKE